MIGNQKVNRINIREARPLLSKLSEEVARKSSYYVITVRDKPKSILTKYDEELVRKLERRSREGKIGRQRPDGELFVDGISKWLKSNLPVATKGDITSQIDKIVYA